jgi:hypothetical protein
MSDEKRNAHGDNINDPDARPADIADHQQRTEETREEEVETGGPHDDQGHTPHLPDPAADD